MSPVNNPTSLFENDAMRKNTKSEFSKELRVTIEKLSAEVLPNATHVINGDHLLHSVFWTLICTYMDVGDNYDNYQQIWT